LSNHTATRIGLRCDPCYPDKCVCSFWIPLEGRLDEDIRGKKIQRKRHRERKKKKTRGKQQTAKVKTEKESTTCTYAYTQIHTPLK